MRAEYFFLFFPLIAGCHSHWDFEQIGDGYYYIGNEKTVSLPRKETDLVNIYTGARCLA